MENISQQLSFESIIVSAPEDVKDFNILYSALDNYGGHPFDDLFDSVFPVYTPHDILDTKGALIIWGGQDISPAIYNQRSSSKTWARVEIAGRDELEIALARKAIEIGMPIIGICRGAQLMCALSGGTVVQHVEDHTSDHMIQTFDGKILRTTSFHHQMMNPFNLPEEDRPLLAWALPRSSDQERISSCFIGEPTEQGLEQKLDWDYPEPEIVWFPKTKSLCIQGHPEFIQNKKHDFVVYCRALVKNYVLS